MRRNGQAEVNQFGGPARRQQDVLGTVIPVDQSVLVNVGQPPPRLDDDIEAVLRPARTSGVNQLLQVRPVNELHHNEVLARPVPVFQRSNHVGMPEAQGDLSLGTLVENLLKLFGELSELGGDDLDRHRHAVRLPLPLVHNGHAPPGYGSDNMVVVQVGATRAE